MKMTDREMLLFSYGAMKALSAKGNGYNGNLQEVVDMVHDHLYPPAKDRILPDLPDVEYDDEP